MTIQELLDSESRTIINEAMEAIRRAHLEHYDASGAEETRRRLETLFRLTAQSVATRKIGPLIKHAEKIADERFSAGYGLLELQTAFNVLEEAIWRKILDALPPDELAEALGLVSTALGLGKDAMARRYVSLSSHTESPSLDLSAIFK